MVDVMQQIKQLCEKLLFHWKTFPIILPTSITEKRDGIEVAVTFKDLFISPTFDELEEVALDEDGKSKLLSSKQLKSVQEMESLTSIVSISLVRSIRGASVNCYRREQSELMKLC
ncbi:hypothetical protein NP493_1211g00011 [Ridgeia piscesae]|uniref:Uncharacterized protein n=1 Tax=Ridgeia piscesae TaxID=27915 RepID=A0AAD9KD42_RIDPI|nr:hypothetical protein NP493_1211g00011 [Ridgeia piscesae]